MKNPFVISNWAELTPIQRRRKIACRAAVLPPCIAVPFLIAGISADELLLGFGAGFGAIVVGFILAFAAYTLESGDDGIWGTIWAVFLGLVSGLMITAPFVLLFTTSGKP